MVPSIDPVLQRALATFSVYPGGNAVDDNAFEDVGIHAVSPDGNKQGAKYATARGDWSGQRGGTRHFYPDVFVCSTQAAGEEVREEVREGKNKKEREWGRKMREEREEEGYAQQQQQQQPGRRKRRKRRWT